MNLIRINIELIKLTERRSKVGWTSASHSKGPGHLDRFLSSFRWVLIERLKIRPPPYPSRSRDSAVGYGLDNRGVGVRVPGRDRNDLVYTASRHILWSTELPIQWISWAVSLGVKRPGREADCSPPTSAEVNKTWMYISTPLHAFTV
jgi:hypothetical protein